MDDLIQRLRVEPTASQFLRTGDLVESLVAERKEAAARIAALEAEKAERESQEPVAFRWLGPGKGWRPVYAAPPVPRVDPDWLANVIRRSNPRMSMTSDELAEKIADAINGRTK